MWERYDHQGCNQWYGTIGKRVADAVACQDDMEIIGVTKTRPVFGCDWRLERAIRCIALLTMKKKSQPLEQPAMNVMAVFLICFLLQIL